MKIRSAEFITSNAKVSKCPDTLIPEYAFIGRSNVGKSSLINMLTGRKQLAKTSGTPGKTQLINHFKINGEWFLVDLPGYGYARTSKTLKRTFQKYITSYFKQRKQLVSAFVLIDIRHTPQKTDMEFMQWLGRNRIPFSIVFTKADKLKSKAVTQHISHYMGELVKDSWEEAPPYFITSSSTGRGRDEVLNYIEQINLEFRDFHAP